MSQVQVEARINQQVALNYCQILSSVQTSLRGAECRSSAVLGAILGVTFTLGNVLNL